MHFTIFLYGVFTRYVTHYAECKGGTAGIYYSTIEAEEAVASSLTLAFLSHKMISKWLPKLAIAIELSPDYISVIPWVTIQYQKV